MPSPDLREEKYLTYEAGISHRQEVFGINLNAYRTEIDGMISRYPTGATLDDDAVVSKRNSSEGYILGYETSVHYLPVNDLELRGNYSWLK